MRGVDRAAAEKDFASGASLVRAAAVKIGDGESAVAIKVNAGGVGLGEYGEIGTVKSGSEKSVVAGVAATVFLGDLIEADAILGGGVEVGIGGNSLLC